MPVASATIGEAHPTGSERSILIESPTSSEDLTLWHTQVALEISEVRGVLQGGTVTTVTVDVKHAQDRSASGTSVLSAAQAVTSTTTGTVLTLGTEANRTVPAGSYIWMETSAGGGSGTLHLSLKVA